MLSLPLPPCIAALRCLQPKTPPQPNPNSKPKPELEPTLLKLSLALPLPLILALCPPLSSLLPLSTPGPGAGGCPELLSAGTGLPCEHQELLGWGWV